MGTDLSQIKGGLNYTENVQQSHGSEKQGGGGGEKEWFGEDSLQDVLLKRSFSQILISRFILWDPLGFFLFPFNKNCGKIHLT